MLELIKEEDTAIVCKLPDSKVLTLDAFEVDMKLSELFADRKPNEEVPYVEILRFMNKWIQETYNIKISLLSVDAILGKKREILLKLKKNTVATSEAVDSTE